MSLTFERVDEILRLQYGLLSKTRVRSNYILHSYYFKDKYVDNRKSEVAREVTSLLNGGVGGYIYVGHLQKFNDNPKRHKDGYLNIGHMDEEEFAQIVKEVTKHYI